MKAYSIFDFMPQPEIAPNLEAIALRLAKEGKTKAANLIREAIESLSK